MKDLWNGFQQEVLQKQSRNDYCFVNQFFNNVQFNEKVNSAVQLRLKTLGGVHSQRFTRSA